MRWVALGVDYEMAGKDLIDSVKLSSAIARALGGQPPEGFNYELFLDDKGQKISKSKGNGLSIEEWLTYASPESLSLFMFQKPMAAKRLYFDVIPRTVDEYLGFSRRLSAPGMEGAARQSGLAYPCRRAARRPNASFTAKTRKRRSHSACCLIWPPSPTARIPPFSGASCAATRPRFRRQTHPRLDRLVHYAVAYFRDFVAPKKRYRLADDVETAALEKLSANLAGLPADASAETIQHALYDLARPIPRYQDLNAKGATPERPGVSNDWFNMIYQVLLGEERGPRLGSFIALYGIEETRALIAKALSGEFVHAQTAGRNRVRRLTATPFRSPPEPCRQDKAIRRSKCAAGSTIRGR